MRSGDTVWVMTTISRDGTSVDAWSSKDDAIEYAMEFLFGEDWEVQLYDDEWDEQSELAEAYDAFTDGRTYRSK